jgi:arsenical pump membrane protein
VVIEVLALAALAAALAAAVARRRWLPEAAVALGGAALLIALGGSSWDQAVDEARHVGPTLALLAGLLVLADGCERAGLFSALADRIAGSSRGSPRRLLALVFGAATAVTVVLGLDATVVLLTPAILVAARRARLEPRPSLFACTHLANSASLLLPISNLTNLLALGASGLSFTRFAALMFLPWLVVLAVEWLGIRLTFRLEAGAEIREPARDPLPRAPLAVIAGTLAAFVLSAPLGYNPAWAAVGGAVVMVAIRPAPPGAIVRALDLPLLGFVLGLAVIVRAIAGHGAGELVAHVLPAGDALLPLLGAAAFGALAANLLNNVPATLVLLPAAAAAGPATVLAVLIGVNVGPNLTPTGSLATMLWHRSLAERDAEPSWREFLRLGLVTVPPALLLATVALWAGLQVLGTGGP